MRERPGLSRTIEIENECWNLAEIYPTPDDFLAEYQQLRQEVDSFQQWRGKLGESASVLADALKATSDFSRRLGRAQAYAMLSADLDMRVGEREAHRQQVDLLHTRYSVNLSWMRPELLTLPEATLESFLAAEPRLQPHAFSLRDLLRLKPHVLGPDEEKLLADAGLVTSSPADIYQTLLNAEMTWPEIETPDGEVVKVTPVEFGRLRSSRDRAFRRRLYDAFLGCFAGLRETFGQSLYGTVKSDLFLARSRGHASCLAAALHRNNVPIAVFEGLVSHAHEALGLLHRYQRLRARALGFEQLESHDLYCPLGSAPLRRWTPAEACEEVLESVRPLGPEYTRRLSAAFQERWVDWQAAEGKRIGAYSAGSAYDVHPFVLMNYTGEFESVTTLAHEMGHAMHSDFSNRAQPYPTANYSIFVAEVASTVNEALLAAHLLEQATDDEERMFLLTSRIDSIRGTLFRQVMFAEFEQAIHTRVEAGEALTGQRASEIFAELLARYHGWNEGAMKPSPEAAIEWAAVPHFYYNFYVYQYATGIIAAEALSQALLADEAGAVERYITFLSAGGSQHPLDVLRLAGVDLESDALYKAVFEGLAKMLDELETLVEKRRGRELSPA
jgi:oligoendopeptidase F